MTSNHTGKLRWRPVEQATNWPHASAHAVVTDQRRILQSALRPSWLAGLQAEVRHITSPQQTYLCICTDCGADCQNPASGKTVFTPGHCALGGHRLHVASVALKLYMPCAQGLHVSPRPPFTYPALHTFIHSCQSCSLRSSISLCDTHKE